MASTPDDGQKDCPKHAELELGASVGFIHKQFQFLFVSE
jgi:hypothetical protein